MRRFADGWVQIRTEYLELCGLPLYLNALVGDDGIVLLDSGVAGTPETSLRGELAEAGLAVEDVSLVVNSHAHPDHMGGNAGLRAIADPRFAGPAAEAAWLEDNDRLVRELWEPNPEALTLSAAERADLEELLGERVRIDHLLRDGELVPAAGTRLSVVTTSGHSPGHIAVHDQDRGVLFTFDDVQGAGVPIAHTDVLLPPLYHDVERYLSGLVTLRALEFEVLVPAHGEHLDAEAARERIDDSITFVRRADEFVAEHLDRHGETTLRELAQALGTRLGAYGGVNLQTMSVARAHLDHQTRSGHLTPVWRSRARGDDGGALRSRGSAQE
jgi:glyoxylase-like metal-dependent hydrolase (beta-lactamase superfamily II)